MSKSQSGASNSHEQDDSAIPTSHLLPSRSNNSRSTPRMELMPPLQFHGSGVRETPTAAADVTDAIDVAFHVTTDSRQSDEPSPPAGVENHLSAMGADISGIPPESPTNSFYGSSSISSLLSQVHQMTNRSRKSHQQRAHAQDLSQPMFGRSTLTRTQETISASRIHSFSLPPRHIADHLVELYFTGVHCYYPWLHTDTFMSAYRQLWTPGNEPQNDTQLPRVGLGGRNCSRSLFYCALNTIYALGCEFSTSTEGTYKDLSSGFMEKAYDLIRLDTLDNGDLAGVQTLLLLAIHLQRTQYPMRCWIVAGMALRIGQEIGLDFDQGGHGFSSLEIEMRRRTWYSCVIMDT